MTQKSQAGNNGVATSRIVGNAITGASAGAVVGVAGGPVFTVIGAVVGLVANVAAGVWAEKRSMPDAGSMNPVKRAFHRRRKK